MQTDQKDILAEYFRTQILTDRKVTVHQHAYLIDYQIDFYCSRFYIQINLSSLYLTQVTFEDLPWFTLSINRQTQKTEDRFKF